MTDRLLFMLSKVQHKLTTYVRNELKKEGIALSTGQIGILLVLDQQRQTTMGSLSQALEIDNAAMTRLVDKLEKQGLVARKINPKDRRQMLISIMDTGLHQAEILNKVINTANRKISQGFSQKEMEVFKSVNQAILENF